MTSLTYRIPAPGPGRLWIGPRPRGERLSESMDRYGRQGITTILSMLEPAEAVELGLMAEPDAAAKAGLTFLSHPIVDHGLPDRARFDRLLDGLAARIHAGEGLLIHCRAGIGRSGMAVCGTLIRLGETPQDAIRTVSEARGLRIPDTAQQTAFIESLGKTT